MSKAMKRFSTRDTVYKIKNRLTLNSYNTYHWRHITRKCVRASLVVCVLRFAQASVRTSLWVCLSPFMPCPCPVSGFQA